MRNIVTLVAISIVIVLLISNTQSIAEEIVIFGNKSKPPKYYLEDGKAKGILIDIMKYVDINLPSSFKFELYPWKRAYNYALHGKGGIIGLSMTNQRLEKFDCSEVMYYDTIILVVLKGNEFSYDKITDLQEKIIGIQRGASYGEELEQSKKILQFEEDDSGEQRLLKLLNNRIDVALIGPGNIGLINIIKQNNELTIRKDEFVIIPKPFCRDPNYFAFSKKMNRQDFLSEFNKVLIKEYESGDIQRIINNYSD